MVQERGFSYPRSRNLQSLAMSHGWSERGRLKDAPPMGDRNVPSCHSCVFLLGVCRTGPVEELF